MKAKEIKSWEDVPDDYIDVRGPYFKTVRIHKNRWGNHTVKGDSTGGGHEVMQFKLGEVLATLQDPDVIHRSKQHEFRYVYHRKKESRLYRVVVQKADKSVARFVTAFPVGKIGGVKGEPVYRAKRKI